MLSPFPAPTAQGAAGDVVIEQKLTDEPPVSSGNFGRAVAMDGDRLVVLAYDWQQGYELRSYRRQGVTWSLQRSIATDYVRDIDLSGDTLAVALPYAGSGQVRIYDLSSPQTAPVILPDPFDSPVELPYSGFAWSVAVDEGRVVVGVYGDPGKHHALFYERSGTSWSLAPGGMINPGDTAGWFGRRVDISGDIAAVPDANNVYLYRRRSTGWALEDKVASPGGNYIHDEAGALVSGDTLMLSQRVTGDDDDATTVFELRRGAANRWQIEQRIPVPGKTLGVAYSGAELATMDLTGLVQLWDRQGSGWVKGPSIALPPDGAPSDVDWGGAETAMGVSAGRVSLGVPKSWPQGLYDAGRVTILRRGGPPTAAPTIPTALRVTASKTAGTATVSWRRPAGGAVASYLVRAEPRIASFEAAVRTLPATTTSTTFTGLRELAEYRFSVLAIGPGGEGPVARSGLVRLGGPATVGSPYVLQDPAGDHRDARQDIRSMTVDATGEAVTFTLRTAAPRSPYTDPMYRQAGRVRFRLYSRTPEERGAMFDHISINEGLKLPDEDYVLRYSNPRPCPRPVFAARYVDGAIQATVPARCFDNSRALRFMARTSDAGQDRTAWSPPVTRPAAKGNVSVSNAKATSTQVWASLSSRVSVSYTAKHSSGIARATTRIFSQWSGQRPVRLQSDSCRRRSATTSTCTATFTLKPGEVRDTDSGAWRVFTQVQARNGSLAVKENAVTFGVRRATSLDRSTGTVRGGTLTVKSQLVGARWNNHDYPALGGRNLLLELKPRGSDRWQTVRTLRTDAQGRAAATVTATRKGSWRLRFGGATTYAPSTRVIATTR